MCSSRCGPSSACAPCTPGSGRTRRTRRSAARRTPSTCTTGRRTTSPPTSRSRPGRRASGPTRRSGCSRTAASAATRPSSTATTGPARRGGRARASDERRRSEAMAVTGVDVNGAKGPIDWGRVRQAGFDFAILKATEGRTFDDERFVANRRGAKAAGLVVGAYHFARPDNNTPQQEAAHFLRVYQPQQGELLPALDWETDPPTGSWALAFLRAVEQAIGTPPMLYTFPDFLRRTGSFGALAH